MWDSSVDQWSVARKDFTALGGAYGALSDSLFLVDNNLLDQSLYPVAQLQSDTGGSSGVAVTGGGSVIVDSPSPSAARARSGRRRSALRECVARADGG